MAQSDDSAAKLPSNIEESIKKIAQLHAEHQESATPIQRSVNRMTALLSQPRFIAVLTAAVGGWIILNLLSAALGFGPIDPPPFSWLSSAVSIVSLYLVVLILVAERHEDLLGERREQLILELAILSEQKTTKVIQLLEESRRDNPLIRDRVDREAEDMAKPSDPQTMLAEIAKIQSATGKDETPPDEAGRG